MPSGQTVPVFKTIANYDVSWMVKSRFRKSIYEGFPMKIESEYTKIEIFFTKSHYFSTKLQFFSTKIEYKNMPVVDDFSTIRYWWSEAYSMENHTRIFQRQTDINLYFYLKTKQFYSFLSVNRNSNPPPMGIFAKIEPW